VKSGKPPSHQTQAADVPSAADAAAPAVDRARPTAGSRCPLCSEPLPEPRLHGSDRLHGLPGTFDVSICSGCGAGITLPLADREDLAAFYPGGYGAHDAGSARTRTLLRRYRRLRDRLIRPAPPISTLSRRPAGRLLDVGCGKGGPSAPLLRHGWQVVGIDPSPAACAVARERGLDARVGTLQKAELPADFDAVLFNHSLEHVPDPVDELTHAARLVRSGGLLLVAVPNFDSWQRKTFGDRWLALDLPRHRTHFTSSSLRQVLERSGFDVTSASTRTTLAALPLTLQFALFGRAAFRGPLGRRVMAVAYLVLFPLVAAADRLGGGGDSLTVVAAARPR
jgi:SAM-dependent methyltransferase